MKQMGNNPMKNLLNHLLSSNKYMKIAIIKFKEIISAVLKSSRNAMKNDTQSTNMLNEKTITIWAANNFQTTRNRFRY